MVGMNDCVGLGFWKRGRMNWEASIQKMIQLDTEISKNQDKCRAGETDSEPEVKICKV